CSQMIGKPFKLSSFLARTVRAGSAAQAFHVDVPRGHQAWPMVNFILMVDEFRADNGATRFVPGSHKWSVIPEAVMKDPNDADDDQVFACGPAGSVIVYDGSVWHGHSRNSTDRPRRSIQGAYVRREVEAAWDHASRIRDDTLSRISPLAKYVLGV